MTSSWGSNYDVSKGTVMFCVNCDNICVWSLGVVNKTQGWLFIVASSQSQPFDNLNCVFSCGHDQRSTNSNFILTIYCQSLKSRGQLFAWCENQVVTVLLQKQYFQWKSLQTIDGWISRSGLWHINCDVNGQSWLMGLVIQEVKSHGES